MPEQIQNSTTRRGRPRSGEREERRARVLEAAFEELVESGYDGVTMLKIAKRAGASKETLYSWFGSRHGLFNAMITSNGEQTAIRVREALAGDGDPAETLTGFCVGLLTLLTTNPGVALNRAAMNSPELAEMLLASGRHRVGPIVEEYLATLDERGIIEVDDPSRAFTLLYGLAIRDSQIRVLLGEAPPPRQVVVAQAGSGVAAFLELTRPGRRG
ncbi:MAG: TetR/AcrR family transcriptional regulator [Acidimicrobiales bacterium]